MFSLLISKSIATSSVVLGLANHLYLNRYEPTRTGVVRTACLLLLEPVVQLFALNRLFSANISKSSIILAYFTFFASMATSIVLYRISPFHPLAKVPGPMIFKITKFWRMYICWTGKQHIVLKELHNRYGPIIRSGPNDVSVIDRDSIKEVLGSEGLPKGPAYLSSSPVGVPPPLFGTNGQEHTDRRRVWGRGFSSESIKEYQQIVIAKANKLSEALSARAGKELDLTDWMTFFAFDFMAEMAFGTKTEMLRHGKDDSGVIELIHGAARFGEITSHVPWLTHLLTLFPSTNFLKMRKIALVWGSQRAARGSKTKDLWYHLVCLLFNKDHSSHSKEPSFATQSDEEGREKVIPGRDLIVPDSLSAIIAGSDTTSTATANFFWCILSHPEVYKRIVSEVDKEYPPGTDPLLDTSRYGDLKFLKACLNESLRFMPPVPSNGPRVVPKGSGGKMICGHFITEGTQVQVPPMCAHYNPDNFSPNPESFIPERWIAEDSKAVFKGLPGPIIMKTDAFIPFSYGPANCVGKHLAMSEMMMLLTMLIQRFHFEFAKGFEWKEWPEKKVDAFLTINGPLKVIVKSKL
ncbi:hypothetical protein PQX77_012542 [Marasmius sp. AFHP31]|nr:hypothetical protein PQX77_012542 [Marasmius sp. AFHP31]